MRRPLAAMALLSVVASTASALAQSGGVPTPAAAPSVAPSATPPAAPSAQAPTPPDAPAEVPSPAAPPPAAAPAAVPTSPAPVAAEQPTPAPMLSVNTPRATSADTEAKDEPVWTDPWQEGHGLGVELLGRFQSRFGSGNDLADSEQRAGLGFDLGLWLRLASEYGVGLVLKRADLGSVALSEGQTIVNAGYASTLLELGARAYPYRGKNGEIFLGLRVGMAWQDVDATGLGPSIDFQPAQPFSCSDVSGPGFALGADLGGAVRLTRPLWLTGGFAFDGEHLTSERVGDCVAGIGSIAAFSFGGGLLYTFDIGSESKVAARPSRRAF